LHRLSASQYIIAALRNFVHLSARQVTHDVPTNPPSRYDTDSGFDFVALFFAEYFFGQISECRRFFVRSLFLHDAPDVLFKAREFHRRSSRVREALR
jgi:hypothetical protein